MEKKFKISVSIKNNNEKIEAIYYHSNNVDSQVVLILHGDKENYTKNSAYLNTIFDSFMEREFSVLMVNFSRNEKNIIKSVKIDTLKDDCELEKETEEATVALNWVHEKNFEAKDYWICSIGKGVIPTLQLVMRRPEINNYILIDPIMKKDDLSFIVPCLAFGMIMRSESNIDFTDDRMSEVQEKLMTKTESKVESETIYDNDKDILATILETKTVLDKYIDRKQFEFFESNKTKVKDKKRRRRKKTKMDSDSDVKIEYINPIQPLDLDDI